MEKTFALSVVIGAALAGSFKGVIGQSISALDRIGKAAREIETAGGRIDRFTALKKDVNAAEAAFASAQSRVGTLAAEMRRADAPTKAMERDFNAAKVAAASAKRAFADKRTSLELLRREMAAAGQTTRGLSRQQRELGRTLDMLRSKEKALGQVLAARQANAARRAEFRAQALDAVALGAAIAAPIKSAIRFESAMADVRKVVDFETPAQFRQMGKDILDLSTRIPLAATGFAAIVAAAGQAGLARDELLPFAEDAAKIAVAFDIDPGEAGSQLVGLRTIFGLNQDRAVALADAFNHLGNNMDTLPKDLLEISARAGSTGQLLGLTGQQVAALGATFKAMKTPTQVAGTAMNAIFNRLATADKQGAAFQDALSDIALSATDLKDALKRDAQGALLGFFKAVKGAEDVQGVLTDLFGMEFSDDVAKIIGGLDEYEKALAFVANEAAFAGSSQKEFEDRAKTTENNLQRLGSRVTRLGVSLGTVLLPGLNAVASVIGAVVDVASSLADTFPGVTTVVVGATVGLIALKIAAIGAGWAGTFVRDGFLLARAAIIGTSAIVQLATLRFGGLNAAALVTAGRMRVLAIGGAIQGFGAALVGLASRAIPIMVGGLRVLRIAILTNPVGLIVGGLAIAAGLIIANWSKVRDFFKRIWEPIRPIWEKFTGFVGKVWETISAPFKAIGKFLGIGGDDTEAIQPAAGRRPVKKAAGAVVGAALAATPVAAVPSNTATVAPAIVAPSAQPVKGGTQITNQITITVEQRPGEDAEALARRIKRLIETEQVRALHD